MFWKMIAKFLSRPAVADWLILRAARTPYSNIVKDGQLYMERYWLFNPYPDTGGSGADRPRWQFPWSIRIHHIVLPDQDQELHDHPWNARTIILGGWYREERLPTPGTFSAMAGWTWKYLRATGDTATLAFGEYHKITDISEGGVWTMFITGPYQGTWGFLVNGVKVKWRDYLGLTK